MKKDDNQSNIILYTTEDGQAKLQVKIEDETVWLTQKQMAILFDKGIPTINEHITNIFKEGELNDNSVIRKFRITACASHADRAAERQEKVKSEKLKVNIALK